jgi:hypothetical protein
MVENNLTNTYRKSIENADIDAQVNAFKEGLGEIKQPPAQGGSAPTTTNRGFLGDVGAFIKEIPEQFVGGVNDAINNTVELARDAGEAVGIPNYALQYKNEKGEWDFEFLNAEEVEAKGGLDKVLPEFKEASTAGGNMLRALTTFATGFIPATQGLKAAGAIAKVGKVAGGMIAGGVADAVVSDPHQQRLATFLNEVPALGMIIPDYIADNDPANESNWEGRIKNVIEGAIIGGTSEALIGSAVKMFKGYKVASIAKKAGGGDAKELTPDDALKQMEQIELDKAAAEKEFADKMLPEKSQKMIDDGKALAKKRGQVYINMDNIKTDKDIKAMMQRAADLEADKLNAGGKTFKGIKEASKKEMKDINDLLGRPTTRPFSAEEALAARNILTSSADHLTDLGRLASMPSAGPVDLYNFKKGLAIHNDIQTKVFGGRKATAQSLAAWRIDSKSQKGRLRAIQEMMARDGKDAMKTAKLLTDIADNGGNVSQAAGKLTGRWASAHYQVWINGLLSSPATHGANFVSNVGTTLYSIPERYMQAGYEMLSGSNGSALAEANARATGLMSGISDGFKLMTGEAENLQLTNMGSSKLENVRANPISAEAWGKQPDSMIGKGLDWIGKAVGLPGWALQKSDNFFKGINYRMMLNEKSSKQAFEEGLTGKAFKMRVADLVENPPEPMMDVAVDFARYQTFTNTAGEFTTGVTLALNRTEGVGKYIVPFVRTPSNIIKYGFERTPLAPLMGAVREEIQAGGSQAAAAYSKMSGGSLIMMGIAGAAMNENVTGGGPSNWDERRALEATGWKPYSVKVGDKYISYERFEPIGSLIAYSTDITSIMGQTNDEDSAELVAAGLAAFAKNLSNKTFVSGMVQFVDVVNSGNPAKIEAYMIKMAAGMVQPFYSSAVKKGNNYFDDNKRDYKPDDVNGTLKSIFMLAAENVPGMGRSAPILKDVWGEDQHYSNGIAPIMSAISPINISADRHDPVNNMIAKNRIPLALPERSMEGIKLTNVEYAEYSEIAGKQAKEEMDSAYASGLFEGLSEGPDGEIALITKQIISQSRAFAKGEVIMNNPELEDRIYQNKLDVESKLIGE